VCRAARIDRQSERVLKTSRFARPGSASAMHRRLAVVLACLLVQACSMVPRPDPQAALFSELFDAPYGTCRQLRAQMRAEIEAIRSAKQKARDDFIAEEDAPKAAKPPPPSRKEDPLATLREWSKRSAQAEKINQALEERRCGRWISKRR
jgi:hypothetical protein